MGLISWDGGVNVNLVIDIANSELGIGKWREHLWIGLSVKSGVWVKEWWCSLGYAPCIVYGFVVLIRFTFYPKKKKDIANSRENFPV